MKLSQFRRIIKEEVRKVLKEVTVNPAQFKTADEFLKYAKKQDPRLNKTEYKADRDPWEEDGTVKMYYAGDIEPGELSLFIIHDPNGERYGGEYVWVAETGEGDFISGLKKDGTYDS